MKRKYRETGLPSEKIEEAQRYLNACANFYKLISMKDAWKVIGKRCSVAKAEMELLLPVFERDDDLFFYLMREDELYEDGTDALLLVDQDYMTLPNPDCTEADRMAWVEQGEAYEGPEMLIEDIEIIYTLAEEHADKPLYIPADILLYDDPMYLEDTPQVAAMRRFLEREAKLKPKHWDYMEKLSPKEQKQSAIEGVLLRLHDIICDVSIDLNDQIPSTMEALENYGFELRDRQQLQRFVDLFTDMSNHTRMPSNRGFTPGEMMQSRGGASTPTISFGPGIQKMLREGELDGDELRQAIAEDKHLPQSMRDNLTQEVDRALAPGEERWFGGTLIKGAKIRPNDPCPCGSGKKYKKCCGKNVQ